MTKLECETVLQKRSVSGAELTALLEARAANTIDFLLIDTREKYEHEHHYINGTDLTIYSHSFYPKIKTLKDKTKAYILYCSNGARSALNCETMREIGYEKVMNLQNGVIGYGGDIIWRDSQ